MLKKIKNQYSKNLIENIIPLIAQAEYISFDIFDTLIERNVNEPTDIFNVVQKVYAQKNEMLSFNFATKRIQAKIDARKLSHNQEVTLDEIYEQLASYGIAREICHALQEIELETEYHFSTRNNELFSLYSYCVEKKKKILFTSDMYLPQAFIKKLLKKHGYIYEQNLYLSSQYKKNKSTGKFI